MSQGHCVSADIWGSGTILYQLCFLLRRLVYPNLKIIFIVGLYLKSKVPLRNYLKWEMMT